MITEEKTEKSIPTFSVPLVKRYDTGKLIERMFKLRVGEQLIAEFTESDTDIVYCRHNIYIHLAQNKIPARTFKIITLSEGSERSLLIIRKK